MKEIGQSLSLPDSQFIIYHHSTYGGTALETLPEEDGDNEEILFGSETESSSTSSDHHWTGNLLISPLDRDIKGSPIESNEISNLKNGPEISLPTIRHEIESQRAKVQLLEATIRQLRDELRESKDQNELLEFRLLELEELESATSSQVGCEIGKRCNRRKNEEHEDGVEALVLGNRSAQVRRLYEVDDGTEASSEVTNQEEGSTNSHSSVTEARSSCSDCSESLSFQESGIFENQFTEDTYTPHSSVSGTCSQEEVSRELATLVSQIETLVERFRGDDGNEVKGSEGEMRGNESKSSVQRRKGNHGSTNDLSYESLICRQRIQEFERKLTKLGNVNYVQSLEDKISFLIQESQKLEEEKAELEEAENDSRNQCQRFEEKVKQLREKKTILQHQVSNERRFIEQLRMQILQLQENEEDLHSHLTRLEAMIQSHEQRNFELEESYIEIKDSIQFVIFSLPALLTWILWSFRRVQQNLLPLVWLPSPDSITLQMKKLSQFGSKELRSVDSLSSSKTETGVQTSQELWQKLSSEVRKSYGNDSYPVEKDLRPLNLEIVVKCYDEKLKEKDLALEASRQKFNQLQRKWDTLIKDLEEFEVESCTKNPNEPVMTPRNSGLANTTTSSNKIRQGTLVANRIRSLFPDELNCSPQKPEVLARVGNTIKNITITHQLQRKVLDHFQQYETKQKTLLDEIDRLKVNSDENVVVENQNKQILHLTEENNRLSQILSEQETLWMRIEELEKENSNFRIDLKSSLDLQRRIDEAQGYAKFMMNRVEELEQSESVWKETLVNRERKDKEKIESLVHLRSEIQIMTNKCCLLQDELDLRVKQENQYKHQIHLLNLELKESLTIIQDKESLLAESEVSFLPQICKLETQVNEAQQEIGDLECSNGMLREEVLYFERTLAEVSARAEGNEKLVLILTSKLQEKEDQINELRNKNQIPPLNDLDVFAKNDGGLIGVAREVKEVMILVENCITCKLAAGGKLREVSEQLNTLTLMLEGSQDVSCVYGTEGKVTNQLSLSRCESEEHLSHFSVLPQVTVSKTLSQPTALALGSICTCRCQVKEDNKVLKSDLVILETELLRKENELGKLEEKVGILRSQLKGLEEISARRQNDLRESHLNESWWWKLRCEEKNELIQILARRIAYLSATDIHGYFLEGVLREIRKVHQSYPTITPVLPTDEENLPLDASSLLNYFNTERSRIMDILESSSIPAEIHPDPSISPSMDFRVLRRIGDDALLVSWCANPSKVTCEAFDGYEVCVNGSSYLRIPNPNRWKALLLGLNMAEPLQLSLRLRSSNEFSQQESSITYIA